MKFRKGTKIACGLLTLFLCLSVAGAAFGAGQSSSDVAAVPQPDESTVLTFPHVNGFEDVIEWVLTFPHVDTVLTFPHVDTVLTFPHVDTVLTFPHVDGADD